MFPRLFEPLQVGIFRIPNRIVMPAMGTNLATSRGEATSRLIYHYATRAAGGAGLVIVEGTYVHPTGKGFFYQLGVDRDELIPALSRLAAAVHSAGALILLQLHHGGRNTDSDISGSQPLAPSPVRSPVGKETPREMSPDDIREMIQAFVDGARRAREAGFDGVELHGAHEYLISQFLSPYSNYRRDDYGGSLEKRLRFAREIIQNIRLALGPDFLLSFRISGDEYVPRGIHLQESLKIAGQTIHWGVDLLNVSGGVYETPHLIIPPLPSPAGVHLHLAQAMKQAWPVPVIGVGRINDPFFAEKTLEEGRADLVATGRALLADPEWPRKARSGNPAAIRRCVGCNQGCIDFIMANHPVSCLYNPDVGREEEFRITRTENPGRAVVVGAGPAGLEAAVALDQMGHRVFLFEKAPEWGGQLKWACRAPAKIDFEAIIRYYSRALQRSAVEIFLNTEATLSNVRDLNPDGVILASGSIPVRLEDLGIETGETVILSIIEAFAHPEKVGQRVLILGGGNSGCEAADFLSSLGRRVTILEMGNRIARDLGPARRYLLTRRLRENGVKNLIRCQLKSVSPSGVSFIREGNDGHRRMQVINNFDTFINALGVRAQARLAPALHQEGIPVQLVGDALHPGKILNAVAEGARAARDFNQKLKKKQ